MYQLLSGRNAISDRFYRALYAVLLTEGATGAAGEPGQDRTPYCCGGGCWGVGLGGVGVGRGVSCFSVVVVAMVMMRKKPRVAQTR